jgi:hypothetical protein
MPEVLALNPAVSGVPLGQADTPTTPPPDTRLASVGIPVGGSLATTTPSAKPEPFSKQELASRDWATREFKLNDADANRWSYLDRMSVNVGTAHPKDGGQLIGYVDTLRNNLAGYSADVKSYGDHIQRLEANPWSKVPFSDHNKELNWARNLHTQASNNLKNTRNEIDALLRQPQNQPYQNNAINQPRR